MFGVWVFEYNVLCNEKSYFPLGPLSLLHETRYFVIGSWFKGSSMIIWVHRGNVNAVLSIMTKNKNKFYRRDFIVFVKKKV